MTGFVEDGFAELHGRITAEDDRRVVATDALDTRLTTLEATSRALRGNIQDLDKKAEGFDSKLAALAPSRGEARTEGEALSGKHDPLAERHHAYMAMFAKRITAVNGLADEKERNKGLRKKNDKLIERNQELVRELAALTPSDPTVGASPIPGANYVNMYREASEREKKLDRRVAELRAEKAELETALSDIRQANRGLVAQRNQMRTLISRSPSSF